VKRNTWQRDAVREALGGSEGFVSAQALHASLKGAGSTVGLATVYRALADLATEGEADSLQQDGESLYRACTPGTHHHHLICRSCGTTVEITADEVEAWAQNVAARHGFTRPQHIVDVFGYCPKCSAAGR
jgi:Fur family ferric uptake transcriptional regulator